MSCSDFSIDSLECSELTNSNDNIKYARQNTTSDKNEWQLIESIDLMSVPLYSGPVSLQELKRIEVNGDKILELETKEFSSMNKKKYLSSTTNKSSLNVNNNLLSNLLIYKKKNYFIIFKQLKNFKHPKKQEKNYNPRYHLKLFTRKQNP